MSNEVIDYQEISQRWVVIRPTQRRASCQLDSIMYTANALGVPR
jgi:hypothetical protein